MGGRDGVIWGGRGKGGGKGEREGEGTKGKGGKGGKKEWGIIMRTFISHIHEACAINCRTISGKPNRDSTAPGAVGLKQPPRVHNHDLVRSHDRVQAMPKERSADGAY